MEMVIKIEMGNAAFDGDAGAEVARILREAADKIEVCGPCDFPVRDINGNKVGNVALEGE